MYAGLLRHYDGQILLGGRDNQKHGKEGDGKAAPTFPSLRRPYSTNGEESVSWGQPGTVAFAVTGEEQLALTERAMEYWE